MAKVTIAGGGVLGSQIAFQIASYGHEVTVYDINDETIQAAKDKMSKNAEGYATFHDVPLEKAREIEASIAYTDDPATAVEDTYLLIEAIVENFDIKKSFYEQFGAVAPEKTIFGSNTSNLLPSSMMDYTGRPEKYIALHFSNPVYEKPLVEIMATSKTDPALVDEMVEFFTAMDMVPAIAHKEVRGYLFNSVLIPWEEGGLKLLAEDTASAHDIDRVWLQSLPETKGVFGTVDLQGLDVVIALNDGKLQENPDEQWRARVIEIAKERRDQGKRGIVDGEGFYTYPDPEFQTKEFLEPQVSNHDEVLAGQMTPFLRGALRLVADEVGTPADIDKAWAVGRGVPSGPFAYVDQIGLQKVRDVLQEQFGESGDDIDRKAIDLLSGMIDKGETGKDAGVGFYDYTDGEPVERTFSFDN